MEKINEEKKYTGFRPWKNTTWTWANFGYDLPDDLSINWDENDNAICTVWPFAYNAKTGEIVFGDKTTKHSDIAWFCQSVMRMFATDKDYAMSGIVVACFPSEDHEDQPEPADTWVGKTFGTQGDGRFTYIPVVHFYDPSECVNLREMSRKVIVAMKEQRSGQFHGIFGNGGPKACLTIDDTGTAIPVEIGNRKIPARKTGRKFGTTYNMRMRAGQIGSNVADPDTVDIRFGTTRLHGEYYNDGIPFFYDLKSKDVILGTPDKTHSTSMKLMLDPDSKAWTYARKKLPGADDDTIKHVISKCGDGRFYSLWQENVGRFDGADGEDNWITHHFGNDRVLVVTLWYHAFKEMNGKQLANVARAAIHELAARKDKDLEIADKLGDVSLDKFVLVFARTAYVVDLEKKKVVRTEKVDDKTARELSMARAIHLESQDVKRNYFEKFRKVRDERNQEVYNHTPSKTEAEYRWMNTIGDSVNIPYGRNRRLLEYRGVPRRKSDRTPDKLTINSGSLGSRRKINLSFDDGNAIPFYFSPKKMKAAFPDIIGENGRMAWPWTHSGIVNEFPERMAKIGWKKDGDGEKRLTSMLLGRSDEYIDTYFDILHKNNPADLKNITEIFAGRIWVVNPEYVSYNYTLDVDAVVAWWNEIPTDRWQEINDTLIEEFEKASGMKIRTYAVLGNDGKMKRMTKGGKARGTRMTAARKKGLDSARAIHLAGQEDKRTYFEKFRQERDKRNQEVYNHTPSRTEAEYRWMNTIGDSYNRPFRRRLRMNEDWNIPDRKCLSTPDRVWIGRGELDPSTEWNYRWYDCNAVPFYFSPKKMKAAFPHLHKVDQNHMTGKRICDPDDQTHSNILRSRRNEMAELGWNFNAEKPSARVEGNGFMLGNIAFWKYKDDLDRYYPNTKKNVTEIFAGRMWIVDHGNDCNPFDAVVAWWNEVPTDRWQEINDTLIEEFEKESGMTINTYVVLGNDGKFVKMTKNSAASSGKTRAMSDGRKLDMRQSYAMHLADQGDKRAYYARFRAARDAARQQTYNHTPSRTEAEWRQINTIGDGRAERYGKDRMVFERKDK